MQKKRRREEGGRGAKDQRQKSQEWPQRKQEGLSPLRERPFLFPLQPIRRRSHLPRHLPTPHPDFELALEGVLHDGVPVVPIMAAAVPTVVPTAVPTVVPTVGPVPPQVEGVHCGDPLWWAVLHRSGAAARRRRRVGPRPAEPAGVARGVAVGAGACDVHALVVCEALAQEEPDEALRFHDEQDLLLHAAAPERAAAKEGVCEVGEERLGGSVHRATGDDLCGIRVEGGGGGGGRGKDLTTGEGIGDSTKELTASTRTQMRQGLPI